MSVQVRISMHGQREVAAAIERLSRVGGRLRRPMLRTALFVRRTAQRRLRSRRSRWGLSRGLLARSLTYRVDDGGMVVGSALRYAAIQQVGGDVVPRTARALAIPVAPHLRRSGIWPRDLPRDSMRFVPVNRGDVVGLLVRAKLADMAERGKPGAGGPGRRPRQKIGETLYVLMRRVRVPGQPYLVWDGESERFLVAEVEREYRRTIGAGGGA